FVVLSYFFFQAEDGIRVYKVTGVQTCALPISAFRNGPVVDRAAGPADAARSCRHLRGLLPCQRRGRFEKQASHEERRKIFLDPRSEERRVGKECRCWWRLCQ